MRINLIDNTPLNKSNEFLRPDEKLNAQKMDEKTKNPKSRA